MTAHTHRLYYELTASDGQYHAGDVRGTANNLMDHICKRAVAADARIDEAERARKPRFGDRVSYHYPASAPGYRSSPSIEFGGVFGDLKVFYVGVIDDKTCVRWVNNSGTKDDLEYVSSGAVFTVLERAS